MLKRFSEGPGSAVVNIATNGTAQGGTDASIDYGVATNITRSSNDFSIDGLRFRLTSVGGPFTVTVAADADKILEKVQNFITEYNTMMVGTLNTLSEARFKLNSREVIMPLTDEQKEAMSESDIAKWEERCKLGLLRSDTFLEDTMSKVRLGMYQNVNFEPDPKYPQATINGGSSRLGMSLTWNQPLYYLEGGVSSGALKAFASGEDLAGRFDYVRVGSSANGISAATYTTSGDENAQPQLAFTFTGTPVAGDTIVIKDGAASNVYDADGDQFTARRMTYDGSKWVVESLNAFSSITDIGITTESYQSGSRGGQLVLNESTLRDAINQDVDAVINLLFKEPPSDYKYIAEDQLTAAQVADKRSRSGVIPRMFDNLTSSIQRIIIQSGVGEDVSTYRSVSSSILIKFVTQYSGVSTLEKEELEFNKRIDTVEDRMTRLEDMYWRKFTAMEKALQKMNEQMQNFQSKMAQTQGQ